MEEWLLGLAAALWLGILTSISPCPLATNVAALSFISRHLGAPRRVLWAGLYYTAGRTLSYVGLAILLMTSLLSIPQLSQGLQEYLNKLLGPVLILAGMFLLELLQVNLPGLGVGQWAQRQAEKGGLKGAALLGMVFALSFCPVSAALFFGSLLPLALKLDSRFSLPLCYGVGTALPVLAFALLLAVGSGSVSQLFGQVTQLEPWGRKFTGVLFIAIGIYYSLSYIFSI